MSHQRVSSLNVSIPPPMDDKPLPVPPPPESPDSRGRLRKPLPAHASPRSGSAHVRGPSTSMDASQPSLQELQQGYAQNAQFGTESPLLPPPPVIGGTYSRSSSKDRSRPGTPSSAYGSRPSTPSMNLPPGSPDSPATDGKKKSGGLFSRHKKDKHEAPLPKGWIAGHPQRLPYDVDGLLKGAPMQELWDDVDGNCFVYLFPKNSGKGASFRIDSAVFGSSPVLTRLAFGDIYSGNNAQRQPPLDARVQGLSMTDTPPASPKAKTSTMSSTSSHDSRGRYSNLSVDSNTETHLYLPIKLHGTDGDVHDKAINPPTKKKDPAKDTALEDMQTLIDIRNLFAFLCGQGLVATERKSSFFHIFMTIAGILKTYEFSNFDGSTYGEVASSSFDSYVQELGLADVRTSREKTIESIVLGERMKSTLLYNESFTHAAGKHDELVKMNSPKYSLISSVTQNRLVRAAMDLEKRTDSIHLSLNEFEFPTLFVGIMSSKTSEEHKEGVRFHAWKEAFLGFRKNLLAIYRARYGDWPPKAKSKKNNLETSGLNRLVVRDMYHDMSSIYDLMVDRSSITSRTVDGINPEAKEEPTIRGLRAVMAEYDRSSPPVKPPVPFDLPLLPSLRTTRPDFGKGDKKKDIKAIQKKLKDDEVAKILRASWNEDALVTPFVDAFREMEKRAAHGSTIAELVDLRIGQWIFMYVVLQALPMLAVDAPGLQHTKGVEYFLCEIPRSGVPWAAANASHAPGAGRTWFSVGDGGGVVSLPTDVVEHGVEGIYRRSHCWVQAEKWAQVSPRMNEALRDQEREAMNAAAAALAGDAGGQQTFSPATPSATYPAQLGQRDINAPELNLPDSHFRLAPLETGSRPTSRASNRNSSIGLGLEALPLPVGINPDGPIASGYQTPPLESAGRASYGGPEGLRPGTPQSARPRSMVHTVDSSKTFDAILAGVDQGKGKKKK